DLCTGRTTPPRIPADRTAHRGGVAGEHVRPTSRRPRPRHRGGPGDGRRRRPRRRRGRPRRGGRRAAGVGGDVAPQPRRRPARRLRRRPRAHRRLRPADDARDGQVAGRVAQRGGLRRRVPALVRRGGGAHRRPLHAGPGRRLTAAGDQPAGRTGPAHHAVELPARDGHPQDRSGRRRRLHHDPEAGRPDATHLAAARPGVPGRRAAGRRPQRHPHVDRRPDHRAAVQRPPVAQALVHRLHAGRSEAAAAGRDHGPAHLHGAGWQRTLPRLRGRRPRRRRGGCPGRQAAQHRRGVHRGQPLPRARGRRRRLRRRARRALRREDDRARHGRRRRDRPADRRTKPGQGPGDGRRRGREGRDGAHRRRCRARGRVVLRADRAHRRPPDGPGADGGGLRAGGTHRHLPDRGRGHRGRERHPVRPRRLRVHPRPRAGHPPLGAVGDGDARRQHRHHLQPRCPLRWREAVRPGTRGWLGGHRGVPRDGLRGDRAAG
ncbi:MAG: Succinate-semialdehyde dehydrogenase [NAD(P)+], partial [uncultured Thermomicrobiales bacterium]